eukprot:c14729_g1_i1.p1 GENE.c14729_g1_i1~~c14729_g1_i1.p1  ORF type:complete len:471 (+),score=138.39 c14729_g1_i1:23-1414(+)
MAIGLDTFLHVWRECARLMFYVEEPSNMNYKVMSDAPHYVDRAIPYFFLLMAIEMIVDKSRGIKNYRVNDTVMSLNLGAFQQLSGIFIDFWIVHVHCYLYDNFRVASFSCESVWTWVALFFLVDFGYYWFHRFAHEFHYMWLGHSVHHSGEDYNLATALRQGAFQGVTSWVFYLPLDFFFPPICIIAHKELNTLFQFWIHTSAVGRLGPLEYIFNTASHHRMHHRPPGNCNYAGVLIIWDRMFGTFVAEEEKKDYYGLAEQYKSFDPILLNFRHGSHVLFNINAGKKENIFAKFARFFKKRYRNPYVFDPLALFKPIPELKITPTSQQPQRKKYDGEQSSRPLFFSFYILFNFLTTMLLFLYLLFNKKHMILSEIALVAGFIAVSMSSCGRLCDSLSKGAVLETIRLLGFIYFTWCCDVSFIKVTQENLKYFSVSIFAVWIGFFSFALIASTKETPKVSSKSE